MPVPSLITELSTTASSNSPAGNENVFPNLDNYVRAAYAFIAQNYASIQLKANTASPTFTGTVSLAALTASGNASVGGTLGVTGAATLSSALTVAGLATLNGNVVIGNASTDTVSVAGDAITWTNNPTHSGNHTFSGNLTVNGNTTLGNAAGDALTVAPSSVTWSNNPTHSGNHTFSGTLTGTQAGRVPSKQYYRLNSDLAGANTTNAQSLFGVGVTLSGSLVYEFECVLVLSKTAGTTSHVFRLLFGGTATFNNALISGVHNQSDSSSFPMFDNQNVATFASLTPGSAFQISNASTDAAQARTVIVKGTLSVSSGGTLIPQYSLSAAPGGAYTVKAGSYFSIWPLGASGADTNIGTWA